MHIRKSLRLEDVSLKLEGAAGSFSGYAARFGGVDSYGDTILKGAFESTLRTFGKPKMFFNHSWDMPIGKYLTVKEDDAGLFVQGELTQGMGLSADVHAAMKHGTLDGLSIGGFVKKGDYEETDTGRIIRRWSRLVEISPVALPADNGARVDLSTVKGEELEAAIAEIETIRDFERFLRDAGSFSKGAAVALAARVKAIFDRRDAGDEVDTKALADIAARVQRMATTS